MKILKFGGTSVGTADAIRQALAIIRDTDEARCVVVSATAGTTDRLAEAARAAERGDGDSAQRIVADLRERHAELATELGAAQMTAELDRLAESTATLLGAVALLHECTPRTRDAVWAYGERASSLIVAGALEQIDVRAEAVDAATAIVTDDAFGNASPLMDETKRLVRPRIAGVHRDGGTPVVTGFIGATADGVVTTLGRGGSDYSAAILAAALDAAELLIYTDVSGVMSADPRIVKDAKPLASLSYAEAAELSYFGAKVIHPRTVLPAIEAGIPVRILNTFAPNEPGTTITRATPRDGSVVKATTSLGGLALVTVAGAGMSGVPGFAARVFDTTAAEQVSVLMISQSSSENSICFAVPTETGDRLKKALERMLARELARHDVERVTVETPIAIVAAVGEGMRGTPGVAARVFGALGRAKVNVVAIAQGSSELNISLCVGESDREAAVKAIHQEFHKGR